MPLHETKTIDQLASDRALTETHLATALSLANKMRTRHARAVLVEAFPQHSLAVFTRNWDQDEPRLIQLLAPADADTSVLDLDLTDDEVVHALTSGQQSAINTADMAIRLIGDRANDEELWNHLEAPDEEREDWYEFQLDITSTVPRKKG